MNYFQRSISQPKSPVNSNTLNQLQAGTPNKFQQRITEKMQYYKSKNLPDPTQNQIMNKPMTVQPLLAAMFPDDLQRNQNHLKGSAISTNPNQYKTEKKHHFSSYQPTEIQIQNFTHQYNDPHTKQIINQLQQNKLEQEKFIINLKEEYRINYESLEQKFILQTQNYHYQQDKIYRLEEEIRTLTEDLQTEIQNKIKLEQKLKQQYQNYQQKIQQLEKDQSENAANEINSYVNELNQLQQKFNQAYNDKSLVLEQLNQLRQEQDNIKQQYNELLQEKSNLNMQHTQQNQQINDLMAMKMELENKIQQLNQQYMCAKDRIEDICKNEINQVKYQSDQRQMDLNQQIDILQNQIKSLRIQEMAQQTENKRFADDLIQKGLASEQLITQLKEDISRLQEDKILIQDQKQHMESQYMEQLNQNMNQFNKDKQSLHDQHESKLQQLCENIHSFLIFLISNKTIEQGYLTTIKQISNKSVQWLQQISQDILSKFNQQIELQQEITNLKSDIQQQQAWQKQEIKMIEQQQQEEKTKLNQELSQSLMQINNLAQQVKLKDKQIQDQRNQINNLNYQIDQLKNQITQLQQDLHKESQLQQQLSSLKHELQQTNQNLQRKTGEVTNLKQQLLKISNENYDHNNKLFKIINNFQQNHENSYKCIQDLQNLREDIQIKEITEENTFQLSQHNPSEKQKTYSQDLNLEALKSFSPMKPMEQSSAYKIIK